MDIQVILVIILSLLSINLVVVGVFVVFLLKEFRETVIKVNGILENVESVTGILSSPVPLLGGLLSSIIGGYRSTKKIDSVRSIKE